MKPGSGSAFPIREVDAVPIPAGEFLTDKDVTKLIYPFFCEEKGIFCIPSITRQKGK
ncbi:hypothetical protein J2X83_000529 [Brevibacillus nitrificans]|nr:hypothetical protein [Brevibacillus nitrificans]